MTTQERLQVISKALDQVGEAYKLLLTVTTEREENRLTSRFEHLENFVADELYQRVLRELIAEKEASK